MASEPDLIVPTVLAALAPIVVVGGVVLYFAVSSDVGLIAIGVGVTMWGSAWYLDPVSMLEYGRRGSVVVDDPYFPLLGREISVGRVLGIIIVAAGIAIISAGL